MKTRNFCRISFFVSTLFIFLGSACALAQEWKEISGDHFFVYFLKDEGFAKDVLNKAEVYYGRIATDIGYPRYSDFWTWDKRVKVYIYADHESFLKATGQPKWSQGMADYNNKQIISYAWSQGFIESLLPHEMAHLIFRDFVGFTGRIPLWLDEGVAQWAEEPKRRAIKSMARKSYLEDSLLSLSDMMKIDIRNITESDKLYIRTTHTREGDPGVLFLSGDNLVSAYYLQSASLVGFLIEKYGSYSFAEFCRQLRDGKSLEEALRLSYPMQISNLDDFEKAWRRYLESSE